MILQVDPNSLCIFCHQQFCMGPYQRTPKQVAIELLDVQIDLISYTYNLYQRVLYIVQTLLLWHDAYQVFWGNQEQKSSNRWDFLGVFVATSKHRMKQPCYNFRSCKPCSSTLAAKVFKVFGPKKYSVIIIPRGPPKPKKNEGILHPKLWVVTYNP